MKKISLLLAVLGFGFVGAVFAAQPAADAKNKALIDRITAIGSACVEGKPCEGVATAAAATSAAAGGAPRTGEDIYKSNCSACHGTGAMGAPKHGDKSAWAPRLAKGKETLYKHATEGFNSMPPKGMCMTCSPDEIKAAVDFVSH